MLTLFLLFSCGKYDDSAVRSDIEELESRVVALERQCRLMNGNISALQALVAAVQGRDCVVSVATLVTGRDIQSRSLRGGRSPCATGRTKYGKDGADVKEFSQTMRHEAGGHGFAKLLDEYTILEEFHKASQNLFLCTRYDY